MCLKLKKYLESKFLNQINNSNNNNINGMSPFNSLSGSNINQLFH